jgi:glyoxylase-like metal-dependent hydrolase (beta-lactamase superfamily II)
MGSLLRFAAVVAALTLFGRGADAQEKETVQSPRLYVLDGGVLGSDPTRYHLTAADVAETSLSVAAYLIVHPRGVLLWDTGAVPDGERISADEGVDQRLVLANGEDRHVVLGPPLLAQLASIGYAPSDVTYLALSHGHWDHTANANAFAGATWLVRPAERDAMFAAKPEGAVRPETYAALAKSRTQLLTEDEHDVFGDGTVIMKSAPGHTPGHEVLYVKLAHTGGVVLSGDLYHYPAERTLGRLPTFEFDADETRESRREVEAFLARTGAQLWIQHDLAAHRKLKKAPEYYD